MYFTENETTVRIGQAAATVIADSIQHGKRITTLELIYPRYIHSELLTHRNFSRNAASSRARPVMANIKEVFEDPVFFDYVGLNQKGMVAGDPLSPKAWESFKRDWEELGCYVANCVQAMEWNYGIHKQTLNRALEPWLRIRTLVTATDWANFFRLRLAKDAQPEMHSLAQAMHDAMKKSVPEERTVHTPYSDDADPVVSVARCARVSYSMRDGQESTIEEDTNLYNHLSTCGHLSPFEHVAYASEGRYANFDGWQSLRNIMENVRMQ